MFTGEFTTKAAYLYPPFQMPSLENGDDADSAVVSSKQHRQWTSYRYQTTLSPCRQRRWSTAYCTLDDAASVHSYREHLRTAKSTNVFSLASFSSATLAQVISIFKPLSVSKAIIYSRRRSP